MNQISLKRILIGFAILFVLSRSYKIRDFLSRLDFGDLLTLEPLRDNSPEARFLVTLALFALCVVTIFCLLQKRK